MLIITILLKQREFKSEPAREKTHGSKAQRIPNSKLPVFSLYRVRICHPPSTSMYKNMHRVLTTKDALLSSVSRVFTGVPLCRHGWLNQWPCNWTQSPAPLPPQRLIWYHMAQNWTPLIYMVGLSGLVSPHPESSLINTNRTEFHQESPH